MVSCVRVPCYTLFVLGSDLNLGRVAEMSPLGYFTSMHRSVALIAPCHKEERILLPDSSTLNLYDSVLNEKHRGTVPRENREIFYLQLSASQSLKATAERPLYATVENNL